MKKKRQTGNILLAGSLLGMLLLGSVMSYGQDKGSRGRVPEGVYIDLTKEFYEALKGEGQEGSKVYSSSPSTEYLKQISISSKFMVETNLQILKHQEEIVRLLQALLKNRKK